MKHQQPSPEFEHGLLSPFFMMITMMPYEPPPQLWVKLCYYCSSTRMTLALNNPWRLIYHLAKKPKHINSLLGVVEYADCTSAEGLRYSSSQWVSWIWWWGSNGEVLVLQLWGISMPLFPGPLWSRVVVPVRVPFMGQIELFNNLLYLKPFVCKQMTVKLNY